MTTKRYESVWDAIEPTSAEAENMRVRKIDLFSIDALVNMLTAAGLRLDVRIIPAAS